jgi:hypothetical protein
VLVRKCEGQFEGWSELEDAEAKHCVKLFHGEDKRDWHDARSHCRSFGGELVSIHSEQENAKILDIVRTTILLFKLLLNYSYLNYQSTR